MNSVLILKPERLYCELLRGFVLTLYPSVCCTLVQRAADAALAIEKGEVDLVISGTEASDGDTLALLSRFTQARIRNRALLVIATRHEPRLLATLEAFPACSVFDALNEPLENLLQAVQVSGNGHIYWSPTLLRQCPKTSLARRNIGLLTPTERLVFAIIGDGCDDMTASVRLGMKPASVHSVRKSLHGKLRIRQKGELVARAAEYGFVRFSSSGIVPIGLELLLAEYHAQSKRPIALALNSASMCTPREADTRLTRVAS